MCKLVKRILALALVVCMLLGTMVIPTFATEPDAEANTVVYDFTALTQTATAAEGAEVMWAYEGNYDVDGDGQRFYGFGAQSLNISHNRPADDGSQTTTNTYNWINSWYNYGIRSTDGVEWEKDLNWMVIGTKNTKSNYETTWDIVTIGGYKQGDETKRTSWNGLSYIHRDSNGTICDGGWMAIKVKTPGVGTFNVDLQHTVNHYGAAVGSVYIIPGVASNEEIEAAIAAGTGKLDASVNYYMKKAAIQASEGYVTEIGSSNVSLNGQHTSLGTVTLTEVAEEYTVVLTGDAMPSGVDHCRVLPEKLSFTYLGETAEATGEEKNYNFNIWTDHIKNNSDFTISSNNNINLKTESNAVALTGLYENGTIDWNFAGSTFTNHQIRNTYHYFTASASTYQGKYIAYELKSPGSGMYEINYNAYTMADVEDGDAFTDGVAPLWADFYIVKLGADETGASYENKFDSKEYIGSYEPEFDNTITSAKRNSFPLETVGKYQFEENAKYILYIVSSDDEYIDVSNTDGNKTFMNPNMYPMNLVMKPSASVATIGDASYETLTAAVAAANAGDVISLLKNAVVNNVAIPEGVTLDLSGKTLTVGQFTTAMGGKLVDSSAGNGLLNVLSDKANFTGDNALDENILPIYDAENTGYRFYAYSYNAGPVKADPAVEGAVRFWYQLTFEDGAAYDLIATGKSGVTMGVNLAYNDTTTPCVFANNAEAEIFDNAAAWAAAYATFAKTANDPWLWVRVQGVDAVSNLSVAPVITAGNTDFAMDSIAYGA